MLIIHLIPDVGRSAIITPRIAKSKKDVLAFGEFKAFEHMATRPLVNSVEVVVVNNHVAIADTMVARTVAASPMVRLKKGVRIAGRR